MDLNELKKVNDEQGHEAGDSYIRRAAQQIVAVFPEHTYRIGGDEFVVLYPEIKQAEFEYFVSQLQKNAKEHQVNISYGVVWKEIWKICLQKQIRKCTKIRNFIIRIQSITVEGRLKKNCHFVQQRKKQCKIEFYTRCA